MKTETKELSRVNPFNCVKLWLPGGIAFQAITSATVKANRTCVAQFLQKQSQFLAACDNIPMNDIGSFFSTSDIKLNVPDTQKMVQSIMKNTLKAVEDDITKQVFDLYFVFVFVL